MNLELQKGSRSKVLASIIIGVMIIFVFRLFYLQIIQHDYYVDIAKEGQIKRLTIPAKRGLIYALDGSLPVPLVMNQTVFTVFADPQTTKNDSKIIDTIRRVAGGNARSGLQELLNMKESRYQILATRITRTQADMIKSENLSGIGFQEEAQRVYPEGALASQALGFVDFSGVGRYGVEGGLDDQLTGTDGLLQSVTDISSVPLTIGTNNIDQPAIDGENIVLSIDRNVQSYAEKALSDGLTRTGATKGSVIVMDPQTGQVIAMANLPSYDQAKFYEVTDASLFNNATISAPYEPGSDIKTFIMATGIDKGVVTPDSTYENTGNIQVDDRIISNATQGHTGTISLQYAFNWSFNTAVVTVAQRLGDGSNITREARNTIYDYFYNKYRLGQLTGIELDGEVAGTIIPPTESDGNAVRYSNMTFGQGLDVTMVQVAAAFCSIANGGQYYKPTMLAGVIDKVGNYLPNLKTKLSTPVNISTSIQMREMTHTARSAFYTSVDKPGYYIGGKTGTSQVLRDGAYSDTETIGTYLGYGGSEELSRYVIMVQVSGDEKSLSGPRDALPIFTDISNWMLNYLEIQPKG